MRSYRDLPLSLYQIQVKFRDEVRPRFGLLRGREFIMKDAYSFHATQESLQEHYDAMAGAYARICERLGLDFRPVEADSGQIGGKVTTEFMALAESGEAEIVYCDGCDYAADVEAAVDRRAAAPRRDRAASRWRACTRPASARSPSSPTFLGIAEHDTVKTMAGISPDGRARVLLRPRRPRAQPGEGRLGRRRACGCSRRRSSPTRELPKGSLGPVGAQDEWDVLVVADRSRSRPRSAGASAPTRTTTTSSTRMPGRDFAVDVWADLVVAQAGRRVPRAAAARCSGARGIEVSQVFQLGTKYSESMGAYFMDEDDVEQPFIMGCYGVGVSRSLAAVVEQYADEAGCAWPVTVAPLEVAVIPLSADEQVVERRRPALRRPRRSAASRSSSTTATSARA